MCRKGPCKKQTFSLVTLLILTVSARVSAIVVWRLHAHSFVSFLGEKKWHKNLALWFLQSLEGAIRGKQTQSSSSGAAVCTAAVVSFYSSTGNHG